MFHSPLTLHHLQKPRLLPSRTLRSLFVHNDKIICTRTEIVLYSCPPHSHRDEPLRGDVAISVLGCAPILTPHLGEFSCYKQTKKDLGTITQVLILEFLRLLRGDKIQPHGPCQPSIQENAGDTVAIGVIPGIGAADDAIVLTDPLLTQKTRGFEHIGHN